MIDSLLPLWPKLLAFAGLIVLVGWWARDWRAVWVGILGALGVVLMQVPFSEPWRWWYAFILWTVVALAVSLRRDALWAAVCLVAVPAGYLALAFETGARDLAFGVTEFAWVVAMVAGSWGIPRGVVDHWRRRRARSSMHVLLGKGSLASVEAGKDSAKKRQAP